jgi:hypothetical protein
VASTTRQSIGVDLSVSDNENTPDKNSVGVAAGDRATSLPERIKRESFLTDVIVGVAEDFGCNSWRRVNAYGRTGGNPFVDIIIVGDDGFVTEVPLHFDITAVRKGLKLVASRDFKVNRELRHIIAWCDRHNDARQLDAESTDVVLQAALFGEIVYG